MNNCFSLDGFAQLARSTAMIAPKPCKARILSLVLFGTVALLAAPDLALAQSDGISSTASDPILPDPVPGQGANFPASTATSGTAYGGPPLATPRQDCSPSNPCAVSSSAPRDPGVLNRLAQ
jgi:hypothetical protein